MSNLYLRALVNGNKCVLVLQNVLTKTQCYQDIQLRYKHRNITEVTLSTFKLVIARKCVF